MDSSLALPAPLAMGLSSSIAHALCFAFTSSYVGSLYISQHIFARDGLSKQNPPPDSGNSSASNEVQDQLLSQPTPGSRDHPDTIRLRMKAVTIATVSSVGGVWYVVMKVGGYHPAQALGPAVHLLGLSPSKALAYPLSYMMAPILFLGPLYATYLDKRLPFQSFFGGMHLGLIECRNYVVGPLTEELVFRSTMLAVSILGGLSISSLIFGTPMWFGIAHAHHALETYRRNGSTRAAAIQATLGCMFQLSYTTLFGWFASYLFLRTGSVIPPLISHIFCNFMGIYPPNNAVTWHPTRKRSIYAAYLTGIAGFVYGMTRL